MIDLSGSRMFCLRNQNSHSGHQKNCKNRDLLPSCNPAEMKVVLYSRKDSNDHVKQARQLKLTAHSVDHHQSTCPDGASQSSCLTLRSVIFTINWLPEVARGTSRQWCCKGTTPNFDCFLKSTTLDSCLKCPRTSTVLWVYGTRLPWTLVSALWKFTVYS